MILSKDAGTESQRKSSSGEKDSIFESSSISTLVHNVAGPSGSNCSVVGLASTKSAQEDDMGIE